MGKQRGRVGDGKEERDERKGEGKRGRVASWLWGWTPLILAMTYTSAL